MRTKKRRILIPIDHKWRDLAAYVLLGLELEARGLEVKFCRNTLERFFIEYHQPDAIVLNQVLSTQSEVLTREWAERGVGVYILPTEGIPTLSGIYKYAVGGFSDLSGVRRIYCWNDVARDALLENKTIRADQLFTLGVPRFDFYSSSFRRALLSRDEFNAKYGLSNDRKNLLIATNFTQADFHFSRKDFLLEDAKNLGYGKVMDDLGIGVEECARLDYESRELLIDSVKKFIASGLDANIILKLHPSESYEFYAGALVEQRGKVTIISQELIWDVLVNCDVEIKRSCTTAFESWILGKPTIEFRLHPHEWYQSEIHSCGSFISTNYEELVAATLSALTSPAEFTKEYIERRESVLDRYCGKRDGLRTVELADDLAKDVGSQPPALWSRRNFKATAIAAALQVNDWMMDDIRVCGVKNFLVGSRIDHLGRVDKHVHDADIAYWRDKLVSLLGQKRSEELGVV
ncbi:surface carbohydrate biosynthesis protein [Azonexus sp. IMCC34839]|uniref:surface carbohydrate biosynthesis protein n=1 Tax=Azonexus sp. IMCC34839 TaxID=3133695 RepID=UPI003999CC61